MKILLLNSSLFARLKKRMRKFNILSREFKIVIKNNYIKPTLSLDSTEPRYRRTGEMQSSRALGKRLRRARKWTKGVVPEALATGLEDWAFTSGTE